jgi:hypothetical protein
VESEKRRRREPIVKHVPVGGVWRGSERCGRIRRGRIVRGRMESGGELKREIGDLVKKDRIASRGILLGAILGLIGLKVVVEE